MLILTLFYMGGMFKGAFDDSVGFFQCVFWPWHLGEYLYELSKNKDIQ